MKLNLWQEKTGYILRRTYPRSDSFTMKPTWSGRDANSVGGERLTACVKEHAIICNVYVPNVNNIELEDNNQDRI